MLGRTSRFPLVLVGSALAAWSCGGGQPASPLEDIFYGFDDASVQDSTPDDFHAYEGLPGPRCEVVLLHDTSSPLTVLVGDDVPIHAKVIDFKLAGPASNVTVTFEITKVTDKDGNEAKPAPGAGLETEAAISDVSGLVHNRFHGGETPGLLYTVRASAVCSKPKELQVLVTKPPCGCLQASIVYEGGLAPSSLKNITLSVLPREYTCDVMAPEKPVPKAVLGQKTLTDIYGAAEFDCITAGNYYTLFGTAEGPFGCVAAAGCDDGVFIQPDKCREEKLELYLVALNPTGKYDSVDHFDFTNVVKDCAGGITDPLECVTSAGLTVSKQICCTLYQLIVFFETPGTTIVNLVLDLLEQWFGKLLLQPIEWFKDPIANVITDYLKNNSPDWLKDFFKVGEDMLGIITNLEMYSDLLVSKLQNDFTVQGTQYWTGIALYWKIGCDPKDPGYDECGKMVFSMEDIKNTKFPLDILEGKFTASIADFNKFIMDPHKIKLNYGKLVLFVLDEVILPKLTGGKAHDIVDAAKLWLNCQSLGDSIFGEISQWFGGDKDDVVDLCNAAVEFLLTPVEMFLGALALDTELSVQGTARMVDDDCDLKVDRFIDGKYVGQIQTSESAQSSFTGTFEAHRKQ